LPYAVLVTLHMAAGSPSVLARIIDRSGPLPAQKAVDGEHVRPGRIYVSVPDRHLLVADHRLVVSRGPTEDGHRPAINPLLRSAAVAFGPRAIGVLLSGVLDDGVLGLVAIRSRGGVTVVQRPDDALFPDMPRNALAARTVDHEVTAASAGRLFAELTRTRGEEAPMEPEPDPAMELENRIAMGPRFADTFDAELLGPPSGYTCPDCNGSLMAVGTTNYRCRVGHAWTGTARPSTRSGLPCGASRRRPGCPASSPTTSGQGHCNAVTWRSPTRPKMPSTSSATVWRTSSANHPSDDESL
jgi:two-component system chemotaxis response regulator CheB